jgi:glycosyltransferase involved in cell wall biosynthesis
MMVAIWMVTYNHSLYIEQAIESMMMQNTNFAYKLYIGEDCSTDNTRAICENLQKKYPEKIILTAHEKNIGPIKNSRSVYEKVITSGAKYIAMCEGDDYWTDPYKLHKQVDFLEKNEDYSLCFHKINILNKEGFVIEDFITKVPENYEIFENLAYSNFIHTPSVVFRSKYLPLPLKLSYAPVGDYVLWLHLASQGKIHYIPESMAIYREGVGFWSSSNKLAKSLQWCFVLYLCIDYFKEFNLEKPLQKQLEWSYSHLAEACFEDVASSKEDLSTHIPLKKLAKSLVIGLKKKLLYILRVKLLRIES